MVFVAADVVRGAATPAMGPDPGDSVGYTVDLEHIIRHAGDHPQPRTLRCTQVYCREDGEWKVVRQKSRVTWRSDNTRAQSRSWIIGNGTNHVQTFCLRYRQAIFAAAGALRAAGLKRRRHATTDEGSLSATFGFFKIKTPLANVTEAHITRNYRWWTAFGVRGSMVDDGLSFGTNHNAGVRRASISRRRCHHRFGRSGHSALTVTVADLEGLTSALAARARRSVQCLPALSRAGRRPGASFARAGPGLVNE